MDTNNSHRNAKRKTIERKKFWVMDHTLLQKFKKTTSAGRGFWPKLNNNSTVLLGKIIVPGTMLPSHWRLRVGLSAAVFYSVVYGRCAFWVTMHWY